jgi:hypothetical protein
MKFHHVGIPATHVRPGESFLEAAKLYVTDVGASPYQIEWLRFEDGSPMPDLLKTQPHLAFEVDDLQAAMAGKTVLIEPFVPMPGVRVGFVVDDGAVIEFMQKTV